MSSVLSGGVVAPLTGSVDRNLVLFVGGDVPILSLPSRGAWIEMLGRSASSSWTKVAPLTGSVDRNWALSRLTGRPLSRSPHGERG